ncbi:hypothetical protein LCGC14_1024410 [marine sediment metagenome]|uniref:16S rRNA (pseudouridine-N1-)-methyltransferase Nep1 n=1 Tax=marine sediment metagenome TaxID=412755 RepID=A0A0F9QEH7_9ZZZZ
MPLIIILVECGLELIPKQIRNHPAVKRNLSSNIYSSQLLDNALHLSAMKNLKNKEKRGRPDISHLCLLNALGSVLNKSGHLELYIHTINNKIFKFNSEIRIARNYNRFKGLMAKMLIERDIIANGKPLILHIERSLKELITTFKNSEIFLFSTEGRLIKNYQEMMPPNISKNIIAIIGGFQKGDFSKEIKNISKNLISVSDYHLDAWVIINKVITYYEILHSIT